MSCVWLSDRTEDAPGISQVNPQPRAIIRVSERLYAWRCSDRFGSWLFTVAPGSAAVQIHYVTRQRGIWFSFLCMNTLMLIAVRCSRTFRSVFNMHASVPNPSLCSAAESCFPSEHVNLQPYQVNLNIRRAALFDILCELEIPYMICYFLSKRQT